MNIILIGMPAVGKSTVGEHLAQRLAYEFLDIDSLIVKNIGTGLQNFINDQGIEKFQEAEKNAVLSIGCRHHIISTGGSVVYSPEVMHHIRGLGHVVYLRADFEVIEQRLKLDGPRGLVIKAGQSLKDLYDERAALYLQYADSVVDASGSVKEVSLNIKKSLGFLVEEIDD